MKDGKGKDGKGRPAAAGPNPDAKMVTDKRFAHVHIDPRFKTLPRDKNKVKIDPRFKGMFTEDRFKTTYKVDKYGRRIDKTTSEQLERFYNVEEDEEDGNEVSAEGEEDAEDTPAKKAKKPASTKAVVGKTKAVVAKMTKPTKQAPTADSEDQSDDMEGVVVGEGSSDGASESDESDDEEAEFRPDSEIDYARGAGLGSDSDSEDDAGLWSGEEGESEISEDDLEDGSRLPSAGRAPVTENATRRFAMCNMEWDKVKAVDLFVIVNSFKPPTGIVHSVAVYPSEFGLQRMAEESEKGPIAIMGRDEKHRLEQLQKKKKTRAGSEDPSDGANESSAVVVAPKKKKAKRGKKGLPVLDSDDSDQETGELHPEAMRRYELSRMKYYYAVVDCDNAHTAAAIYDQCDGTEFEASSNALDLRFIPDDVTFDHPPRDVARELPSDFKPSEFYTSALQHSRVKLTWDETESERTKTTMRKFSRDDVREMDFKAYLATSSESEEESEDSDDEDSGPVSRAKIVELSDGSEGGEGGTAGARGVANDSSDSADPSQEESTAVVAVGKADAQDAKERRKELKRQKARAKYLTLLGLTDKFGPKSKVTKAADGDEGEEMEITFEPGLKDKAVELVRKKKERDAGGEKSAWDEYLEKRRQKKKEKKAAWKDRAQRRDDGGGDEEGAGESDGGSDLSFSEIDRVPDAVKAAGGKAGSKGKGKGGKKGEETEDDKRKRAELELLMLDEDETTANRKHFSLKKIMETEAVDELGRPVKPKKKKRKARDNDTDEEDDTNIGTAKGDADFEIDVHDPRFAAMYSSHKFQLDPTHPQFKRTKSTAKILEERTKRRRLGEREGESAPSGVSASASASGVKKINDASLSLLVNSVKNKAARASGLPTHQKSKK